MSADWPWEPLGLTEESDVRTIKRAYAQRLKQIDRSDPEAFEALRDAYQSALSIAEEQSTSSRPSMIEAAGVHVDSDANFAATPPQHSDPAGASQAPGSDVDPDYGIELSEHEPNQHSDPRADAQDADHEAIHAQAAAADAFWEEFDSLLDYPLPVEQLEDLLDQQIAQSMQLRLEVEERLLQVLEDAYEEEESRFQPTASEAEFIEDTFGWLSDGVGFNNRLGYRPYSDEVLHALNRAQKLAQGIDPNINDDPEYSGIGHYQTIAFVLWMQMGLGAAKVYQKDPTLNFGQILWRILLFMFCVWVINRILRVFARARASYKAKTQSKRPRRSPSKWRFVRWLQRMRDNQPLRSVLRLCVAGLLATALFITAHRMF